MQDEYDSVRRNKVDLHNIDIVDLFHPNRNLDPVFQETLLNDFNISTNIDLITVNPPWLPAKFVGDPNRPYNFDNAIYDPEEAFLLSSL